MFLVKNKYLAEFLRRKKISGSLKPGRGKGFCVMRDGHKKKVAVSHMIRDWASHFLTRDLVFCKRDA